LKQASDKNNTQFPTMVQILQLNNNWDVYHIFTKEFVRIAVGKKVWKNNAFLLNLSEYCAASSKAFCLLVVENKYAQWSDMVGSGDHGDKHNSASAPLYTNAGKSNQKNGAAKPFQGWIAEGYKRFDVIYNMVKADRAKDTRSAFEEELKRMVMEEYSKKGKPKRMMRRMEMRLFIWPMILTMLCKVGLI
jgi:hypothetical protein